MSPDAQTLVPILNWDGLQLCLQAPPRERLELSIDGSRFCWLDADDDGRATLRLPFPPSGNARLDLRIRAIGETAARPDFACSIEMGKAGWQPPHGGHLPLRPVSDAEQLLAVDAQPMQREVAVVVPVYNAPDAVRRCLDSVLTHSSGPWRLIVIDDASSDATIAPLLDRYRALDGVEVLGNPQNLGYTATINRGIRHAGRADVVLLNADTEVAAHWLTGLRLAAASAADVATATAVSDNAGAFSVPELEQENPIPCGWTFAQAARALWQHAGHAYPQLPTGNGFCMYIRREVLDAIGDFDVEAFPQGYGEENDFCQRASARGYRHVIAGNVFVGHARSQSFGIERRESLGRAGMQVLRERWPNYEADVGATLHSFERQVLDWRVRRIYASAAQCMPRPRMLRVGAATAAQGASSDVEMFELVRQPPGWVLRDSAGAMLESLSMAVIDGPTAAAWLQRHAIERIEIAAATDRTIADVLAEQAERLGIAVRDTAVDADPTPNSPADATFSEVRR